MPVRIMRDHKAMPWANGGGMTYEVARFPYDGDFDWRISLADVDSDGPFSILDGIDRWIVLLDGGHVTLNSDMLAHQLNELEPYFFAGEMPFVCTLSGGPAKDLNVMTRRGKFSATVEILRVGTHSINADNGIHFVVCTSGEAIIDDQTLSFREAAQISSSALIETTGSVTHIRLDAN